MSAEEPLQYNYWQRATDRDAHIEAMASLIARQDRELAALREVLDAARLLRGLNVILPDDCEDLDAAIDRYDALGEQK